MDESTGLQRAAIDCEAAEASGAAISPPKPAERGMSIPGQVEYVVIDNVERPTEN